MNYFLPDGGSYAKASMAWSFGKILEYGVKHGRVWGSYHDKKLEAVAIWQPPFEAGVSIWNMMMLGFAAAPWKFGMSATWRMMRVLELSEWHHKDTMQNRPHWTLYSIAVVPSRQSKGLGTALIQPVLQAADSEGISIYLDTDSERSLHFFENNGWKVVKDLKEPPVGPQFWTMLREPRKPI